MNTALCKTATDKEKLTSYSEKNAHFVSVSKIVLKLKFGGNLKVKILCFVKCSCRTCKFTVIN